MDDLHRMWAVPLRRAGRTSLERAHKREHQGEGDGEQQYEKADGPQEKGELPSMGATVAECGRSLSAGSALQHRTTELVSPEWVSRHSFQQIDADSAKSLYFGARTCLRSCRSVGQPFTARSS